MKLISMLLALLIIGYLITHQLNRSSTEDLSTTDARSELVPPKVPQRPQDVPKFETDINQFVEETKAQRDKALETLEQRAFTLILNCLNTDLNAT